VETSLGLNTARTIIDQRDRTNVEHRERIRRNMRRRAHMAIAQAPA
jgi:hypothetical protein